jgi:hypothetical protein
MPANTKIALAAALMLGATFAAHAQQKVVKSDYGSKHARGSYAQAPVRPSAEREPTGVGRPLTVFERTWFDYQSHDDQ